MSQYVHQKDLDHTVITQINDSEFLVESNAAARFGFEIDESVLTFANIQNGPIIHSNKDFLGKGLVTKIIKLDDDEEGNLILKVTVDTDG